MEDRRLSFQEAAQEALAEDSTEMLESEDSVSAESPNESGAIGEEQLAVESDTPTGLFGEVVEKEVVTEQPSITDDSFTFEVDGEHVSVAELRAGYMRQSDYTRKTQEISSQREELKDAKTLWDALHGPDAAKVLTQLYNRVTAGQGVVAPQAPKVETPQVDIEALVAEKVEQQMQQFYQGQQALSEIDNIFGEIERDYEVELADSDKQLILEKAQELGTLDLVFVFNGLLAQKNRKEAERRNVLKNATSTPSGVPEEEGDPLPTSFKSFREAAADTLKREGIVETAFNF